MKVSHAMIDLETMGTKQGSAIVSIGAVVFDPRVYRVTKKTFYRELDWESQDRLISNDCMVNFWGKQNEQTRSALYGLDDLPDVLIELGQWLPKDCKVWGNGATFDISMLENAYDQHHMEYPWEFWNVRDCRTIKDLYESARGGWDSQVGAGAHNALHDAIHQAQYICKMWKSILKGVNT